MLKVIFLAVIGILWIGFASIQDLKKREVANWLSFSLIVFALGFRFFYSFFSMQDFDFFWQGLVGLGIFFILGNVFYYGRMFAGGDAKLMIALGAVLGFTGDFLFNLKIYFVFLTAFLFSGMVYGLFWTVSLMLKNIKGFKKEFFKIYKINSNLIRIVIISSLLIMISGIVEKMFLYFGLLVFFLVFFYIYAKAVDEACMIRKVNTKELVEGDWLYKDVKVGNKVIKANWNGLDSREILLLKKSKKEVLIRQGIPFVPVFFITFLILIYLWFASNIWFYF